MGGNKCEYKTTVLRTTPRGRSTPRVLSSRGGTNQSRPELERVRGERVHEAELEPVEEVPVLPRLVLAVVGAGDDLAECDAEGGRDDVVDAENTEGEGQDVGCVEAGEGEDSQEPPPLRTRSTGRCAAGGGEDASETGLAGAGHRARDHRPGAPARGSSGVESPTPSQGGALPSPRRSRRALWR